MNRKLKHTKEKIILFLNKLIKFTVIFVKWSRAFYNTSQCYRREFMKRGISAAFWHTVGSNVEKNL